MRLCEDGIGGSGPLERLAVRVVSGDKLDAGERTAADSLVGDQREEALELVQPRAVARNEVLSPARPRDQLRLDLRVAVGDVVVAHAVTAMSSGNHLCRACSTGAARVRRSRVYASLEAPNPPPAMSLSVALAFWQDSATDPPVRSSRLCAAVSSRPRGRCSDPRRRSCQRRHLTMRPAVLG